jgi:hypothetical protein
MLIRPPGKSPNGTATPGGARRDNPTAIPNPDTKLPTLETFSVGLPVLKP